MLNVTINPPNSWYTMGIRETSNEYRMGRNRLKPKNDFIFRRLFGEEETKESLISLLNAILRLSGDDKLVDIKVIQNNELLKEQIKDKTGRLDIRAETTDGVQIDIEMQLTNERNMDRRTLFYFGKVFLESIKSGEVYQNLKKTITINILDFNFLDVQRYHSTFHLYEDHEKSFMLTDVMEIHFIEYPKFRAASKDMKDPLHRWLLFLEEHISEQQIKELMDMDPVIKNAEERLEWLSSDEETMRWYEFRENSRIERNSLIHSARAEGKEEGAEQRSLNIARKLLQSGMDVAEVAEVTELSVEKVERLR